MEEPRVYKKWGCWFKAVLVSLAILAPVGLIASSKIHSNNGLTLIGSDLKSPDWVWSGYDASALTKGANFYGNVWQIRFMDYENYCKNGEQTRRTFSKPIRFGFLAIEGQGPQLVLNTNIGTTVFTDDCDAVRKP